MIKWTRPLDVEGYQLDLRPGEDYDIYLQWSVVKENQITLVKGDLDFNKPQKWIIHLA